MRKKILVTLFVSVLFTLFLSSKAFAGTLTVCGDPTDPSTCSVFPCNLADSNACVDDGSGTDNGRGYVFTNMYQRQLDDGVSYYLCEIWQNGLGHTEYRNCIKNCYTGVLNVNGICGSSSGGGGGGGGVCTSCGCPGYAACSGSFDINIDCTTRLITGNAPSYTEVWVNYVPWTTWQSGGGTGSGTRYSINFADAPISGSIDATLMGTGLVRIPYNCTVVTVFCPVGTDKAGQTVPGGSDTSWCNNPIGATCESATSKIFVVTDSAGSYSINYLMTNSGGSTWNSDYSLRLVNSSGALVSTIPLSSVVYPGNNYTFPITLWSTSPPPSPAILFTLQMQKNSVPFGSVCSISANVPRYRLIPETNSVDLNEDTSGKSILIYKHTITNDVGSTKSPGTNIGTVFVTVNGSVIASAGKTLIVPILDASNSINVTETNINLGELSVGTVVCSYIQVTPYTNESVAVNTATSAKTTCKVVGAKPYFKAFGGDIWVGGNSCAGIAPFDSLGTLKSQAKSFAVNDNRGSSTDVALFSTGIIDGVFSASRAQALPSYLSFSNNLTTTFGGVFGTSGDLGKCMEAGYKDITSTTTEFNSVTDVLPDGTPITAGKSVTITANTYVLTATMDTKLLYVFKPSSGVLRLSGTSNIKAYVDGDAVISGSTFSARLIASNKNISFTPDVQNASGAFYANGILDSCTNYDGSPVLPSLLYSTCLRQLNIFGRISATKIKFHRTFGDLKKAPANETYNTAVYPINNAAENVIIQPTPNITTPDIGNIDTISALSPVL